MQSQLHHLPDWQLGLWQHAARAPVSLDPACVAGWDRFAKHRLSF